MIFTRERRPDFNFARLRSVWLPDEGITELTKHIETEEGAEGKVTWGVWIFDFDCF
jgi:hypothetical protein